MEPPEAPQESHTKRHDCVGLSYFSAWMRTHGQAPVCVGFSQVTAETHAPADGGEAATPPGPHEAGAADFKYVCIGYSSYANGTPASLPHCEGIEFVMQEARHTEAPNTQMHLPLMSKQQQDNPTSADPSQQQQIQPSVPFKFLSKASQNLDLIMAAARNEGPVKLKAVPQDWHEMQERVVETVNRNGARMSTAANRLAASAYTSTLRPLGIILGIVPRPKS